MISTLLAITLATTPIPAPASTYVLLYGVGDYPSTVDAAGKKVNNSLLGPPNDVADMKSLVSNVGKVPSTNTLVRLNKSATADMLTADLKWVASRVKVGDTLLFYFSGHGLQLINKAERDGLDEGIVFSGDTFVVDDDIRTLREGFNNAGINTVFIFDSCFSGGMSRNPTTGLFKGYNVRFSNRLMTEKQMAKRPTKRVLASNTRPKSLPAQQLDAGKKGYGLILEASGEGQSSVEIDDIDKRIPSRGIFTWLFTDTVRKNPTASLSAVMKAIIREFDDEGVSDFQRPQFETYTRDTSKGSFASLMQNR